LTITNQLAVYTFGKSSIDILQSCTYTQPKWSSVTKPWFE